MPNNEGESVATMWGRLLKESQDGPVELADKWGNTIAVMLGWEKWRELNWDLLSYANTDMRLPMPSGYVVGMAFDDVTFDE